MRTVTKIIKKDWRNAYAYLDDKSVLDVWYRTTDKKYVLHHFLPSEQKTLDEIAKITPMSVVC